MTFYLKKSVRLYDAHVQFKDADYRFNDESGTYEQPSHP